MACYTSYGACVFMIEALVAKETKQRGRLIWVAMIFLAVVGVGVAARRTIVLLRPGTTTPRGNSASAMAGPAAEMDAHFASQRTLTLAHVVPAMLFMILGPLQLVRQIRERYPAIHRWSGRVFLMASAVVGVTGLRMALGKTIGGVDEKAAIVLFGSFFLVALTKALVHAMRREFAQHREWMIRGYATGLAVATIRPIMGMFFAAAVLRRHTPEPKDFFGTAFWIGFVLQAIVAELWIARTRTSGASAVTLAAAK